MILVTGGTGFVGSYLIHQLIQQGKRVRAIRRKQSQSLLLNGIADQVEWVEGDVLDIFSLEKAMEGAEQVYHCAAIVSFNPKEKATMMKVNIEGTANLVNTALHKGVKKVLHVSSITALGRTAHRSAIDEKVPWEDSPLNSNYSLSKYLAEMEVWRGVAEGLNAVIVNPSVILGSGDWSGGALRFFTRVWKGMPYYSTHTTGFVDVRDVARVMVILMESDHRAERFIVSSENLAYREVFNRIADGLGKKRPHLRANPFLSELAWRLEYFRSLVSGGTPLITQETARIASHSFCYDNSKIKKALNYQFIPIQKTLQESCEKFLESIKENKRYAFLA